MKNLPKVGLHLHIEGTFKPELLFEIAQRNNIPFRYPTIDALKKRPTLLILCKIF